MTDPEIDRLLAEMCVAWPNHQITEPEARLWRSKLAPVDPEVAFATAGALLDRTRFWPHWSEFRAEMTIQAGRVQMTRPQLAEAPPDWEEQRSRARSAISDIRAQLGIQPKRGEQRCSQT